MTTTTVITGVNVNNITPPRVPFLDERTGLISRPWYLWFLNMFARVNQGDEVAQLVAQLISAPDPSTAGVEELVRSAAYEGSLLAPIQNVPGSLPGTLVSFDSMLAPAPVYPLAAFDPYAPAARTPDIPNLGGLVSLLLSIANVTQQLTNVDTIINFQADSAGSFGNIIRTGNTFTTSVRGTYIVLFEPQIRQDKNNNVTTFWVNLNGVAIPGSGVVYEAAAIGDNNVVSVSFAGVLQAGDVLTFHAITNIVVGSTLLFTPAAAPAPSVTAAQVIITGYKTS